MYQTMAKRNQEEKNDAAKQRMVHSHVAPIIEVKKSFRYLQRNHDIIIQHPHSYLDAIDGENNNLS